MYLLLRNGEFAASHVNLLEAIDLNLTNVPWKSHAWKMYIFPVLKKNSPFFVRDIFQPSFSGSELSPKFNCCKMEYLFILRFKGPLRFSMFRTCLSRKLVWPCVFLNGLRDFSCRAPFWRPCTFACVPVRFFQSVFVAPLQHGHSSRWECLHVSTTGWKVFLILPLTRDCIFFPGKAHVANSRSAASSLVRMDRS